MAFNATLGRLRFILTGDTAGLTRALGQAEGAMSTTARRWQAAASSMDRTGRKMTRRVTLPILAGAAAAVKVGVDFETSMSKIVGLVGLAADEVEGMKAEVIKLSGETARSPKELAEALFFITSAGLRGQDALDALAVSARASASGLGETKVVADLVTSAMNAYGPETLNAAQATDTLVAAVREGKAEAPDFAASMGNVLPVASQLGVQFDEVAAATAAMTRTGTDANKAAIQLRQILFQLLKPTEQSSERLASVGTSAEELRKQLREEGLLAVLERLTQEFKGNEEAMGDVFGNVRALAGVFDIMGGNADANREIFKSLTDTTGSLDRAFGAASDTAEFSMKRSLNELRLAALNASKIVIPFAVGLASVIGVVGTAFNALDPAVQNVVVGILLFTAVLGPALVVTAKLIKAVQAIQATIAAIRLRRAARGFQNLANSMTGAAGAAGGGAGLAVALGAVALAVAGGIVAWKLLGDKTTRAEEITRDLTDAIRDGENALLGFNDELERQIKSSDPLTQKLGELGFSIEDVRRLLFDTTGEFSEFSGEVGAAEEAMFGASTQAQRMNPEIQKSGEVSHDASRELDALREALEDNGDKFIDAGVAAGQFSRDTADAAIAANTADDGTVDWIGALRELGFALGSSTDQIRSFQSAVDKYLGIQLDVEEATNRYEERIRRLREGLDSSSGAFDRSTEAGGRNRDLFASLIRTTIQKAQADARASDATDVEAEALRRLADGLAELRDEFPELRDEIDTYIEGLDAIPESRKTDIEVDKEEARQKLEEHHRLIQLITPEPGMFDFRINVETGAARQELDGLEVRFGELAPSAESAGEEISRGIGRGIRAGSFDPLGAVRNLIDRVVQAARERAEAKSPSRLTAREIGLPMSQGIAEGIDQGAEDVEEEIRTAVQRALDEGIKTFESAKGDFISKFDSFGNSVKSSFESSFDLTGAEVPEEGILKVLQKQRREAEAWSKDLRRLARAGLDDGLLQELAQAGPKAAPVISQILDEVRKGNLKAINKTRQDLTSILGKTIETVGESLAPMFLKGQEAGGGLVRGISESIVANSPEIKKSISILTETALRASLESLGDLGEGRAGVAAVDQLFQQFLGRNAGIVGLRTFFGKDPGLIRRSILGSPEFKAKQAQRGEVVQAQSGGTIRRVSEAGFDEAIVPLGRGARQMRDRARIMAAAGLSGGGVDRSVNFHGDVVLGEGSGPDDLFREARWSQITGSDS